MFQFQLWEAPNVPYLSQLRDFARVIPNNPNNLAILPSAKVGTFANPSLAGS